MAIVLVTAVVGLNVSKQERSGVIVASWICEGGYNNAMHAATVLWKDHSFTVEKISDLKME